MDMGTRRGTAATVAVLATLTCSTGAEPRRQASILDTNDAPTAVVRVDNLAGIRAPDLRFAEGRAGAVFEAIGARIVWIDEDEAVQKRLKVSFTLVLMGPEKASGQPPIFMDALGVAAPSVRRAHVYYDRITALNARTSAGILTILGDVMAHELGHLMLLSPVHSSSGIMRPTVNTRWAPVATFSKSQAMKILSQLRQSP